MLWSKKLAHPPSLCMTLDVQLIQQAHAALGGGDNSTSRKGTCCLIGIKLKKD